MLILLWYNWQEAVKGQMKIVGWMADSSHWKQWVSTHHFTSWRAVTFLIFNHQLLSPLSTLNNLSLSPLLHKRQPSSARDSSSRFRTLKRWHQCAIVSCVMQSLQLRLPLPELQLTWSNRHGRGSLNCSNLYMSNECNLHVQSDLTNEAGLNFWNCWLEDPLTHAWHVPCMWWDVSMSDTCQTQVSRAKKCVQAS